MPEFHESTPTVEGYYWTKKGFGKPVIIQILPAANLFYYFGETKLFPLDVHPGPFYGPLEDPWR